MVIENTTRWCPAEISVEPTINKCSDRPHEFDALVECHRCYFTYVTRRHASFSKERAMQDARTEAELALRSDCPLNKVIKDNPLLGQPVRKY